MYKVYVIPGSHACRSAMLMLEHKGVPYRRVDFVPLTHPLMARLHGFDAGGERRIAGHRRTRPLRTGDLLGTVPGLAADGRRISTNRGIARFLEEQHPDPPLFPADQERRRAVEEAERWGNESLQMAARRVVGGAVYRDPDGFASATADGRMGPLLYRRERARRLFIPWIVKRVFAVDRGTDQEVLAELPAMLDRIDNWIKAGVLNGEQLNAADFMIAPSMALMLYRRELLPLFEGRPALDLLDRVLPER